MKITVNSKTFKVLFPFPLNSLRFVSNSYPKYAWIQNENLFAYRKVSIVSHVISHHISSEARNCLLGLTFDMASPLGHLIYNLMKYKYSDGRRESSVSASISVMNNTKPSFK